MIEMRQENENMLPVLFVNNSDESRAAEILLQEANINYQKFQEGKDYQLDPEDPIIPPEIMGRYGDFRGIKGIESFIRFRDTDPRNK